MATCNCMGPQNGEPLCPCQMHAVRARYGAQQIFRLSPEDPEAERRIVFTANIIDPPGEAE